MNIEQKQSLESLNEKLVALQNKCNRAQGFLVQAENAKTDELMDRFIEEAKLELG